MKKLKYIYLLISMSLIMCNSAIGAEVYGTYIKTISTYTQYGNGDVVVKVEAAYPSGCEGGFWLNKNDPGFEATMTVLLSAFHTSTKLSISAYQSQIWTGSGQKHCKINWVSLVK